MRTTYWMMVLCVLSLVVGYGCSEPYDLINDIDTTGDDDDDTEGDDDTSDDDTGDDDSGDDDTGDDDSEGDDDTSDDDSGDDDTETETEADACDDGLDNDSDGFVDCDDQDCYGAAACAIEDGNCEDGLDNDSDGFVDCDDQDCYADEACAEVGDDDDDSGDDDDDISDDDTADDDDSGDDDDTSDDDTGDDDTADDDDDTGDDDDDDSGDEPIDADGDGYDEDVDCDDSDPNTYPGAEELCDFVDNNCDGLTEVAEESLWGSVICFDDNDGDGFGGDASGFNCSVGRVECSIGYADVAGDCDDNDAAVNPDASETCGDGIDQDCDGADETCPEGTVEVCWVATEGVQDSGDDMYDDPVEDLDLYIKNTDQPGAYEYWWDTGGPAASVAGSATEVCATDVVADSGDILQLNTEFDTDGQEPDYNGLGWACQWDNDDVDGDGDRLDHFGKWYISGVEVALTVDDNGEGGCDVLAYVP